MVTKRRIQRPKMKILKFLILLLVILAASGAALKWAHDKSLAMPARQGQPQAREPKPDVKPTETAKGMSTLVEDPAAVAEGDHGNEPPPAAPPAPALALRRVLEGETPEAKVDYHAPISTSSGKGPFLNRVLNEDDV